MLYLVSLHLGFQQPGSQARRMPQKRIHWQMFWFVRTDARRNEGMHRNDTLEDNKMLGTVASVYWRGVMDIMGWFHVLMQRCCSLG